MLRTVGKDEPDRPAIGRNRLKRGPAASRLGLLGPALAIVALPLGGCKDCEDLDKPYLYRFSNGDRCAFALSDRGSLRLTPSQIALRPSTTTENEESMQGEDPEGASEEDTEPAKTRDTSMEVQIRGTLEDNQTGAPADSYEVWLELTACSEECEVPEEGEDEDADSNVRLIATLFETEDGGCSALTATTARCTLDPNGIGIIGVQAGQMTDKDGTYCLCAVSGNASDKSTLSVSTGFEDNEQLVFRPSGFGLDCGTGDSPPCEARAPLQDSSVCAPTELRRCDDPPRVVQGVVRVEADGEVRSKGLEIKTRIAASGGVGLGFDETNGDCSSDDTTPTRDETIQDSSSESAPISLCVPEDLSGTVTLRTSPVESGDDRGTKPNSSQTSLLVRPAVAGVYLDSTNDEGGQFSTRVVSCRGIGISGVEVTIKKAGSQETLIVDKTDATGTINFSSDAESFDVTIEEAGVSCLSL